MGERKMKIHFSFEPGDIENNQVTVNVFEYMDIAEQEAKELLQRQNESYEAVEKICRNNPEEDI